MTYRDSVLGKNPLKFGPHARHGLPIPISRRGRKDPKRKFGHLKARDTSSTKQFTKGSNGCKDAARETTHGSSDQRNLLLPVCELRGLEELIRDQYD